jgi:hypothetical protein
MNMKVSLRHSPTAQNSRLIPTEPVAAKMLDGVEKTGCSMSAAGSGDKIKR